VGRKGTSAFRRLVTRPPPHPRSRVQNGQKKTHTSIQVQRRQSDISCARGAQKVSINQCDETDVSSFVSRSAGAIICCAKFFDAPVDAAHGQTFCLGIADARDDADWRSGMRITLIIALAVASTAITTAHAGSNVCEGTV